MSRTLLIDARFCDTISNPSFHAGCHWKSRETTKPHYWNPGVHRGSGCYCCLQGSFWQKEASGELSYALVSSFIHCMQLNIELNLLRPSLYRLQLHRPPPRPGILELPSLKLREATAMTRKKRTIKMMLQPHVPGGLGGRHKADRCSNSSYSFSMWTFKLSIWACMEVLSLAISNSDEQDFCLLVFRLYLHFGS